MRNYYSTAPVFYCLECGGKESSASAVHVCSDPEAPKRKAAQRQQAEAAEAAAAELRNRTIPCPACGVALKPGEWHTVEACNGPMTAEGQAYVQAGKQQTEALAASLKAAGYRLVKDPQ